MANIAAALKDEISRLARKEIRSETDGLRKAVSTYRAEIAALKKRALQIERAIKKQSLRGAASKAVRETEGEEAAHRFSAKGLKSHRARLGLSVADFGSLVGASGQSIYSWEEGASRPRAKYLQAIINVRALGKREVAVRLEELRTSGDVEQTPASGRKSKPKSSN